MTPTVERPRRKYAKLTFENIANRMTLTKAAKLIHKDPRSLRGAIERGELACIKLPDSERLFVTQELITDWVERCCVYGGNAIPQ